MMHDDTPRPPKRRSGKRQKVRSERPAPETVDSDWRLFIAVPLPEEVRARLVDLVGHLKRHNWPLRWITPENAHITLHFLGDTPPEQAQILRMALGDVMTQHEAFDLRTAGLGVFPKLKRPRVLWLGVWGPAHRLESIYNDLGDVLTELQFPIEDRPFSPHITLGRVRNGRNIPIRHLPEAFRTAIETTSENGLADPKAGLPIPVNEIHLIRSHLEPDGPRYEVIERFPLASRESDGE